MNEAEFIAALRGLPLHPGARGLEDDAAMIEIGGEALIVTHDMIAEGVHYLAGTDPFHIAWKLVAVNLSDLAAKGAEPVGVLIGASLVDRNDRFVAGLKNVLETYDVPLLGGDTVRPVGLASFGCTALGRATTKRVPARNGAKAGDALWVTGCIGDAGAWLEIVRDKLNLDLIPGSPGSLRYAYEHPRPKLWEGQRLAPQVHAMMDVSDGLLIDAARMAAASGLAVTIDLDTVPMSPALQAFKADALAAATAGDDYELLFALHPRARPPVGATRIGTFSSGNGLSITRASTPVPLPTSLGFQH